MIYPEAVYLFFKYPDGIAAAEDLRRRGQGGRADTRRQDDPPVAAGAQSAAEEPAGAPRRGAFPPHAARDAAVACQALRRFPYRAVIAASIAVVAYAALLCVLRAS